MKNTIVVSAFPCCGKSYYFENNKDKIVLDSDSSEFSWVKDENGNNTKGRNPEFPNNYIKHIEENIGKADIIFVSSRKVVRDALSYKGIRWSLVIPKKECLTSWVGRAYMRGSSDGFINNMINNWYDWLDEIENDKLKTMCPDMICKLNSNEYLSDKEYAWSSITN